MRLANAAFPWIFPSKPDTPCKRQRFLFAFAEPWPCTSFLVDPHGSVAYTIRRPPRMAALRIFEGTNPQIRFQRERTALPLPKDPWAPRPRPPRPRAPRLTLSSRLGAWFVFVKGPWASEKPLGLGPPGPPKPPGPPGGCDWCSWRAHEPMRTSAREPTQKYAAVGLEAVPRNEMMQNDAT